jgi:hypothetical protein
VVLHVERRHATRAGWFLAGIQRCARPSLSLGEVRTTLTLKACLVGVWYWPKYRLLSYCWAQDCPIPSRLNVLHGPWQLRRCENTPMAISLTEKGMARMVVAEAEDLIA